MTALTTQFKQLHSLAGGFIMPNAWDIGSALILVDAGFPAIGTTSAGIAFSLGKQDYAVTDDKYAVTRDEMMSRMAEIAQAVPIPVNADLEAGFGDTPDCVAQTVSMAIEIGLAGGNIEDKIPGKAELYDEVFAAERISAARDAINAAKSDFVLCARCDALALDTMDIQGAIKRSNAYLKAGADCAFTPGTADFNHIEQLARDINGPLNMVLGLGSKDGNARKWLGAGVQRVSLGGTMARSLYGSLRAAAQEVLEHGSVEFANNQIGQAELNQLFAKNRA